MATPQTIVPTLQIMNGPMSGRLFQLDREITIIGRNPDCDMVLAAQVGLAEARGDRAEAGGLRAQGPGQHARDVRRRRRS